MQVGPTAESEIADAAAAYEALRPGLADKLLDEFETIRRDVEEFPERWQRIEEGIHLAKFKRFPLGVIYEVTGEAIYMLAIFPTRGDPNRLKDSLPLLRAEIPGGRP